MPILRRREPSTAPPGDVGHAPGDAGQASLTAESPLDEGPPPARAISWTAVPDPVSVSLVARVLLALGVLAYTAGFMYWTLRNQATLGTFAFDMGIHDQAVWLLSRGHDPFVTINGLDYFGDHLSWIMLALVPFYWIAPGPETLLVAQALALGAAGVPLFLMARVKLRSEWLACGIAWAYFLNPYIAWTNLEQFHPDVFAVPLVFLAFLFVLRKRWRLFLVMVVLLMLVKEDIPLLVLGVGVWVAVLHDRRVGIRTAALAALWLFANFRMILPALSGTGSLADYLSMHSERIPFGGLGGFLKTLGSRPWKVVRFAFSENRPLYYLQVFGPLGFLPFLSPSTLLAVILPLAANGLSVYWYQHSLEHHYGALVVPGLVVAAVFGIAHGSKRVRKIMVVFLLAASITGSYLWGPLPFTKHTGPWYEYPPEYIQAVEDASLLIPADAALSADFRFVSRLTHRQEIYEFPYPWYEGNWGGSEEARATLYERSERVEYILVSRGLESMAQYVYDQIVESGEFETVFDRDSVVLLRRVPAAENPE